MTVDIDYDPYNVEITRDPYPTYRRLRDEAPLYYNATHDFFAVSRYDDVERHWSTATPSSPGGAMSWNSSNPVSRCRPASSSPRTRPATPSTAP